METLGEYLDDKTNQPGSPEDSSHAAAPESHASADATASGSFDAGMPDAPAVTPVIRTMSISARRISARTGVEQCRP